MIKIKNLKKWYSVGEITVKALNDINLEISGGEITVIVGPSGSGKTTLLNMIGGIDSPTEGKIEINGANVDKMSKSELTNFRRENVGFIFQFFNLIPNLTVEENIEFIFDYVKDGKTKNAREKIMHLLQMVDLSHRIDHFPFQLSGGEQQRVSIARALAKDPKILLADEPTGELDQKTGLRVLESLVSLASENRAVIIVTHDRELVHIAHKIIKLKDGLIEEIEQNKKPKQVKELYKETIKAQVSKNPKLNIKF